MEPSREPFSAERTTIVERERALFERARKEEFWESMDTLLDLHDQAIRALAAKAAEEGNATVQECYQAGRLYFFKTVRDRSRVLPDGFSLWEWMRNEIQGAMEEIACAAQPRNAPPSPQTSHNRTQTAERVASAAKRRTARNTLMKKVLRAMPKVLEGERTAQALRAEVREVWRRLCETPGDLGPVDIDIVQRHYCICRSSGEPESVRSIGASLDLNRQQIADIAKKVPERIVGLFLRERERTSLPTAAREMFSSLDAWLVLNQVERAKIHIGGRGLGYLGTLFDIPGNPISQRKAFLLLTRALLGAEAIAPTEAELQQLKEKETVDATLGIDRDLWRAAVREEIPDHRTWCLLPNQARQALKIRGKGLVAIARIFGLDGNPLNYKTVFQCLGEAIYRSDAEIALSVPGEPSARETMLTEKRYEIAERIRVELESALGSTAQESRTLRILHSHGLNPETERILFFALSNADELDEREAHILREGYLRRPNGEHQKSLRQIASDLNISSNYVSVLRNKAVRKLSHLLLETFDPERIRVA